MKDGFIEYGVALCALVAGAVTTLFMIWKNGR